MSKTMRNADLYIAQADSELLVLQALSSPSGGLSERALPLSALGYVAYHGYQFKAPQGAALAVAKLVRSMQDRGLVGFGTRGRGYCLRAQGAQVLDQNKARLQELQQAGASLGTK